MSNSLDNYLNHKQTNFATCIFFSPTVTKERTKLSISEVMVFVTDSSTHSAHTHTIYHFTCVAMVP